MEVELVKSIAELGYAMVLIAWLMTSYKDVKQRLRDTQDDFISHLESDISKLSQKDDVVQN